MASQNVNQSDFTQSIINSYKDPEVRKVLSSIVNGALTTYVSQLEDKLLAHENKIMTLENNLTRVTSEKCTLERELSQLLQYTRRNALRITNPAWVEPADQKDDDTDALVLSLAATIRVPLEPWEIGRSHRVGKPRADCVPRPVLVKFISYNVRRRIFESRKKLRDKPALKHIYINEDLTKENSQLAYEARMLKKRGRLAETYTRDGRVFVKRFPNGSPTILKGFGHLQEIADTPNYNQVTTTPANTNASRQTRPLNSTSHGTNAIGNTRTTTPAFPPDDELSPSLLQLPPPELSPQVARTETTYTSRSLGTLESGGATGGFEPSNAMDGIEVDIPESDTESEEPDTEEQEVQSNA